MNLPIIQISKYNRLQITDIQIYIYQDSPNTNTSVHASITLHQDCVITNHVCLAFQELFPVFVV